MSFLADRIQAFGPDAQKTWNRKLCWEAQSTLFSCVDKQANGNKFRCPDELYAYEMWCPTEVRRLSSAKRVKEEREATMFDQEMLDALSRQKQTVQ